MTEMCDNRTAMLKNTAVIILLSRLLYGTQFHYHYNYKIIEAICIVVLSYKTDKLCFVCMVVFGVIYKVKLNFRPDSVKSACLHRIR